MLLAKLKFTVLGLVTLALVSTGVGVLAQTGPDRSKDYDRLKAVERKLDRLLEVLAGSGRRTSSPDAAPATTPVPSRIAPSPGTAPTTVPMPPNPPGVAAGWPGSDGRPVTAPPGRQTAPRASRADLASRVDLLEHRLSELERRFSDLERRSSSGPSQPSPRPAIELGAPASPPVAPPPPASPLPDAQPATGDSNFTLPPASLPSADIAPSATVAADAPAPISPRGDFRPSTLPAPAGASPETPASSDTTPRAN
jgi:hypothetical protein